MLTYRFKKNICFFVFILASLGVATIHNLVIDWLLGFVLLAALMMLIYYSVKNLFNKVFRR